MIGKMLVKEAMNAGAAHPQLSSGRCIDARQAKEKCGLCAGVCPKGAIIAPQNGRIDWDLCVGCELCTSVCPAEAFSLTADTRAAAQRLLGDGRSSHVVGCRMTQAGADMKLWCLGSLRWELAARLALEGRLELVHGDCEACERRGSLPCFDKTIERLRHFLGEERYARMVSVGRREAGEGREVTRRDLFGGLFRRGREQPPKEQQAQQEKLSSEVEGVRLSLVRRMDRLPEGEGTFGFVSPSFTDKCWACGICERICPNRAIEMEKRGEEWTVACYPSLCTGCGTCGVICPEKAIDGVIPIRIEPGVRRVVVHVNAGVCADCGAAIKPGSADTLCIRCKAKARSKRRINP
ncbi:MAG: 4Fe-4S binding protein [Clostridia bacterium]|nr:4Fe-4S binding protein [Clostridia bacterium]